MNVLLEEKAIAMRPTYNITSPTGNLKAVKGWMPFPVKLEVTTTEGAPVANIKGQFLSFFKPKFDISFPDGRTYLFALEKIMSQVYSCKSKDEEYKLITHKGVRFSIFKGDTQVAWFNKNRMSFGTGNVYNITANSDADIALISSMILARNTSKEDGKKSMVNIEVGHIGPEDRPFDESWQPS